MDEADAAYEATKRRKQPTLAEALANVEAAVSPSVERTAEMLYNLGTALKKGPRPSRGDEQRVVDAVSKISGLMLASSSNSSSSMPRIEQLDGRYLSQSAWALSQVRSVRGMAVMQLGLAIAEQALHGEAMKAEGWRNWSGVLYGLARAGISCKDSEQVQQLFAHAVTQRLPQLLAQKQGCEAQSVSNTFYATVAAGYSGSLEPLVSAVAGDLIRVMEGANAQNWANVLWACAKQGESGSGRLGQGMEAILQGAAPAMASLKSNAKPQELSNVLWGFGRFSWYDADLVSDLAAAMASLALRSDTAPQALGNALWALSKLGWYDTSVYSTLTSAFVQKGNDATSQAFSNVLLSCAEARHWDSSMEGLAEFVSKQSEQQWGKWKEQELSNTLYAWAVLTAAGPPAASASPRFKVMAQQLFGQVSRGPSDFIDLHLRQLYLGHQVAVYGKLPGGGLSADVKLLQRSAEVYHVGLEGLQIKARRTAQFEGDVAAALQCAGFAVKGPSIEGGEFIMMQAQGVAIRVASTNEYFKVPLDLLSGYSAIHVVLAGWVCGSSIVVSEAEWAGLKSDPQQQQAYVAQRMQKALEK